MTKVLIEVYDRDGDQVGLFESEDRTNLDDIFIDVEKQVDKESEEDDYDNNPWERFCYILEHVHDIKRIYVEHTYNMKYLF
jgi:hypothetical protein